MRKVIASVLLVGLVGALPATAVAAKKKKPKTVTISETFSAGPLAPMPIPGDVADTGCRGGEEGVHKLTIPFTTPGKGVLSTDISGFQGDWDLYVTDSSGSVMAASETSQIVDQTATTEQITIPLGAKQEINILACNWAGSPLAEGQYTFKYKK